jgi:hypothetical protein
MREPLVLICIFEHCALSFGIVYLLRESASFLSSLEPVLGIIYWMFRHYCGCPSFGTAVALARLTLSPLV